MGSLERRLQTLEGGRGRPCEVCEPDDLSKVEVTWDEPAPDEPERCPGCGCQLVHIITWHDAGEAGGAA